MYDADVVGEIRTVLNGKLNGTIVDSGSNGLFFTPPSSGQLPICPSNSPWFCPDPASTVTLSATNTGASGPSSNDVLFQIGNFSILANSATTTSRVFSNIGGFIPIANLFDWGLPFYFGRNIYVGIEGRTSKLNTGAFAGFTGPYFAY